MKHTYQISGMTCDGCRNHVQKTLSEIQGVTNVEVNLKEKSASIEMEKHILRKYKYPPDDPETGEYNISVTKVLDQAELLAEFWTNEK